jgi:hypothetical protein
MAYIFKKKQWYLVDIDGNNMMIKVDSMRSAMRHVMTELVVSNKLPERVEIKLKKKDD